MVFLQGLLFLLGGGSYVFLELLYRGRSHISMFLAGGLCFLLLGRLERTRPKLPFPLRPVVGAGIITMVELAFGMLFNRNYTVWDYRALPGNYQGQICPKFFFLWIPLAWCAGKVYRWMWRKFVKSGQ